MRTASAGMHGTPPVGALCVALAALASCVRTSDVPSRPEKGLVACYPLDEGAGRVARDHSGGGNDGTIAGATWERAERGWFLHFDGRDDRIVCGSPAALDLRGPLTLSAWVFPAEVPAGEVGIAGKHFTSTLLTYYKNRHAYAYIGDGGNNVRTLVSTHAWSHLVSTFDGDRLRLYLNGRPVAERVSKHKATPPGKAFVIGCVVGDPNAADPNYRTTGFFKGAIAEVKVYSRALGAAEVRRQFVSQARRRFVAARTATSPVRPAASIHADGIRVRAGRAGVLQIDAPHGRFFLQSSFTYPGERIGTNRLARELGGSERTWRPEARAAAGNSLSVLARGSHYSVARRVSVRGGRIEVEDTLTNLTAEPVGILVRHKATMPELLTACRLGQGSEEPVVFAATPRLDLGVVVEDDVARTQFEPFGSLNEAGFHLPHFGLAGGESYTLRWAVYPLAPTGDALVLVNRLRRDWGVNHTILGPCSFFDATSSLIGDPQRLKRYLKRRKLGIAMLSPWLDYDPGSMAYTMPRGEYKAMMTRAKKALKAAAPDIKVIGCIETDWVAIYPERIRNGGRLPSHKGGHTGQVATTPEQTRILLEAGLPWADSMKVHQDGSRRLELYSRGGKPQMALGVYPATGNTQARFLMEQARFLVEEVGLDGFYIDEFSAFWVRSYGRSDGHTVDIDPRTGRIVREYTNASVAGIGPRLALCRHAADKGLVMVANTYATTLAESRLPILRFSETWSSFDPRSLPKTGKPPFMPGLGRSQLGTMVGLGVDGRSLRRGDAHLLMRSLILYLRHGMVYYHYFFPDLPEEGAGSGEYGPINHMFPITPVRLFEGGVIGRERTITCVSGRYEWRQEQKPRVVVFGMDGREKQGRFSVQRSDDGWSVGLRLDDWNEIAVVEE